MIIGLIIQFFVPSEQKVENLGGLQAVNLPIATIVNTGISKV